VGAHAVIGAGAVVKDDVAPRAIAVGIPARVVSTRPSGGGSSTNP
jgi:acetyltransferase-like isoleucine patch superfamily enzyme